MKKYLLLALLLLPALLLWRGPPAAFPQNGGDGDGKPGAPFDRVVNRNAGLMLRQGRNIFRFDTFGDEQFWGGSLQLHKAIEGGNLGGVGPGVSPKTALALGLKVDVDALPQALIEKLKKGQVNLNDPAVTVALLKLNAVLGLTGFFDKQGTFKSLGLQCAICHSTVDNSLTFGIGHRLDGWANRDLDPGQIIAAAPNVKPITDLLKIVTPTIDDNQTRTVLKSWGPGKFDAELLLDGKVTVQGGKAVSSAATMIPNAFGLAGFNQHTWTGAWGTVSYWNALVANLEMQGKGRFFDPRLNNAKTFPIAAAAGFANKNPDLSPDDDRFTAKVAALHFYQLAIPSPKPRPDVDFDNAAAVRGDKLFGGAAGCNKCHVEPLWTEPGWNLHTPAEVGVDGVQASRSPDGVYKTMNLAGLFVRENGLFMQAANKGRFYHDGRFKTLLDVVNHYEGVSFSAGALSDQDKKDLVEYLKALFSNGSAIKE
jgi:hypothetical protein